MAAETTRSKLQALAISVSVIAVPFLVLKACSEESASGSSTSLSTQYEACSQLLPSLKAKYAQHMAALEFNLAQQSFGKCQGVLSDLEIFSMIEAATLAGLRATALDKTQPLRDRVTALESIDSSFPNERAQYAKLLAELGPKQKAIDAAAERKAKAEDRARRRKEGVSLGMSAADIEMSSWGKPRKINRTTNVHGTREQWVYDGGYLYLEDGVLTSIQN